MRRMFRLVSAAAGLVFLAACSDPVSFGDPLSDEEAAAISGMLAQGAADGFANGFAASRAGNGPAAAAAEPADVISFSQSISFTGLCDGGGTVSVEGRASGTVDTQTNSGTVSLDVKANASRCQAVHNAVTFTVDASMEMKGSLTFAQDAPVGNNEFTYKGKFEFTSDDGRAGGCKIDVKVTISPTGNTVANGSICGVTMQASA